jgi:hypothetical protein
MQEYSQMRAMEMDRAVRMDRRRSMSEQVASQMAALDQSSVSLPPGPARDMVQRMRSQLSGLTAEIAYSPDDKLGEIANKYATILSGGGRKELSQQEANLLASMFEGGPTGSNEASISAAQERLMQAPGFENAFQPAQAPEQTGAAQALFMQGIPASQQNVGAAPAAQAQGFVPGAVPVYDPYSPQPQGVSGFGPSDAAAPAAPPATPPATPPPPPQKNRYSIVEPAKRRLDQIQKRIDNGEKGSAIASELADARKRLSSAKDLEAKAKEGASAISAGINELAGLSNAKYQVRRGRKIPLDSPLVSQDEMQEIKLAISGGINTKEDYDALKALVSERASYSLRGPVSARKVYEKIQDGLEVYGQAMGFEEVD